MAPSQHADGVGTSSRNSKQACSSGQNPALGTVWGARGPWVQLEYELASTRQQTDLDADGVTPSYATFHPLRVDKAGGNSNVPGETQTLPLAIYSAIQTPGNEAAAARLASLSIMLALAGLLFSELAGRRSRRLIGW